MNSIAWTAAAGVILSAAFCAFASAARIDVARDETLQPSAVPAMLDPIAENGRAGWGCKAEQAASARNATLGELPVRFSSR